MPDGSLTLAYPEGVPMDVHDSPERGLPWFVLIAHPGREFWAKQQLEQQGFPVYLPVRAPEGREKLSPKRRPFLPGYLFAKPLVNGRWRPMLSTLGVRNIVWQTAGPSINGWIGERQPAAMPDAIVQELRSREAKDGLIYMPDAIQPGDLVSVEMGARNVVDAIVKESRPKERLTLLMRILGREIEVEVKADRVQFIDRPKAAE